MTREEIRAEIRAPEIQLSFLRIVPTNNTYRNQKNPLTTNKTLENRHEEGDIELERVVSGDILPGK
jgi:hypothetical protein